MGATNISVASTATQIVSKSRSSNTARIGLLIRNLSSQAVYLSGESTVTTSSGYPLDAGDELVFDFDGGKNQFFYRGDIYGIVASGTADIRVWELLETR